MDLLQSIVTIKAKEPTTVALNTGDTWGERLGKRGPLSVILAVAVGLVFWRVGGLEFVNYDDPDYVTANPHVQSGLKWQNVGWAFETGHASNWHPLTWISHMLDWQLFGAHPGPQHLVNLALHAANTVLLFLVLRRMTGAHWRSALVAAFFGLHPLRVESVAWISERKDVLSAFFLLLTMAAYGRYVEARKASAVFGGPEAGRETSKIPPNRVGARKAARRGTPSVKAAVPAPWWPWYGLSLVFFALGLMSKPMLVTVPFCFLLLDYWPFQRFELKLEARKMILGLVGEKAPFFLLAAGSSLVTFLVQRSGGAVSTSLPFSGRLANALVAYVRYLGKTFWPANLSVLYPHPGHWPAWQVAGSGVLLAGIVVLVCLWARERPFLPVGWFWFMGSLVPVIGLIQVGVQSMADRYTYIPSIGLFIALVWGLAGLAKHQANGPALEGTVAAALLVGYACVTAKQVGFWQDSVALFQRAIAVTSNNYLAYNNLGFDLSAKGRFEEAKENYAKSLAINPQYPDALNNMGYALAGEKQYAQAIPFYLAALKASPNQPEIHNNLGNALSELGKLDEAIEQYQIALQEQPDHADAHNNLGIALAMQGKLPQAVEQFRAAIRFKPNYASAHSNLGNALAAAHQVTEAVSEYQETLRLNPNDPQAHNNLGNVLVEQGRLEEALEQYRQALRLNPVNPEAEFNLAVVLLRQNQRAEAAAHFQAALRLNPSNLEAKRQLQLLQER